MSSALSTLLRGFLTLALPVLLTLLCARAVMTPLFLQLEYNRPGFPPDRYGFTTADRLRLAPYPLDYMIYGYDIGYLADLQHPEGGPLYNANELRHMVDVQRVTQAAFALLAVGLVLAAAALVALWRANRPGLYRALMQAGVLTWGIIITIVVLAVAMWDTFFTLFHQLFFEEGTWRFLYSDTLIRLFPEQFWFDAALTIGALTALGAGLLIAISWRGLRRAL